jgi:2-polyprenyl-6-methoxyphenol hydroxylase-like FAD-dependent oxidoreductase
MRATVVGGGIGGLATAIGLGHAGWRVTLLERQPALTAAGAGLLIWPNAVHALRALGVGDQVAEAGVINRDGGGVRRADGRWLIQMDGAALARDLGAPVITMHRADLHEILSAALPTGVEVRTGVEITAVPAEGDLVVAADGIHSVLRRHLAPQARVRDSGQVAWRAIARGEFDLSAGGGETVGPGGWRFGLAAVGARGVYWYAAGPGPLRTTSPAEQLAELRARFTGWHAPISALIAATEPDELLQHVLADLDPVPRMRFDDRIALLGDAAHAMTPNLGQGAAQALEDAVTLAAEVGPATTAAEVAAGLARYEAARRPRVSALVRNSRRAGEVFGARGRVTAAVRDLAIRAVPTRVFQASATRTASWRPPAAPRPTSRDLGNSGLENVP